MKYVPKPYQQIIIDYLLNHPRCNIYADMGLGKTSAVLTAIDLLLLCGSFKTLVVAPLRVARSVWKQEVDKWDHLHGLKVARIVGTAVERIKALNTEAHVHVINYDNLPWLVKTVGKNWPWRCIVADESTRLKSYRLRQGSSRAKALASVAWSSRVYRFINLTGTPAPNGFKDLWGQNWFLDHGERLGKSYTAYIDRWFRPENPSPYASMVPMPGAEAEIKEALADITLTLRAKDWFNLREPIVVDVPVELPPKARATYKEMEKTLFAQLLTKEGVATVEARNSASKTIKCLQMCAGACYINDTTEWTETHVEKLDALESIIEEAAGEPIIVAYHFVSDLARLKARFPQGHELDKKESTINDWNRGRIPLLFAHPASAGHGLNLADGGSRIVFFSHWWNLEERQQIVERIGPTRQLQAGHDRPVYIYNIRAVDTIDDVVLARIDGKRSVQESLLAYATKGRTK